MPACRDEVRNSVTRFWCPVLELKRPHLHAPCVPFGTRFQTQQSTRLVFHGRYHLEQVAASRVTFNRKLTGVLWAVAQRAHLVEQLSAVSSAVASDQTGYLRDTLLGLYEACKLVSCKLTKMFVIHRRSSTCRSGSLEC